MPIQYIWCKFSGIDHLNFFLRESSEHFQQVECSYAFSVLPKISDLCTLVVYSYSCCFHLILVAPEELALPSVYIYPSKSHQFQTCYFCQPTLDSELPCFSGQQMSDLCKLFVITLFTWISASEYQRSIRRWSRCRRGISLSGPSSASLTVRTDEIRDR